MNVNSQPRAEITCPDPAAASCITGSHAHIRDHDRHGEGFALPIHVFRSVPMYWCKQLARISRFSSNLYAFCRLDSAWCIGLCIVCEHRDVNACAYTHVQRCVCLLLNCTLLPAAVHDSTVYQYSTLADQTIFWQQLHPKSPPSALSLPLACAWPSRTTGVLRHSANFRLLPQDTWPRYRVENNTIESYSYLAGMMTAPTQCRV
jgi:hypothetical protein